MLYEILTGPMLWISILVFSGGLIARIVFLFVISLKKDRIFYNHVNLRWAIKSLFHWLVPWGSDVMRKQPVFSLVCFLFHISLLITPLFLLAHNVLLDEAWGVSLWSLPDEWSDNLTILFLASSLFLFIRRLWRPEVRIITGLWDYLLMVLTVMPFLTGFLAYNNWGPYDTILQLHILSGEILLIFIPFSKLGHMVLFFFTRSFIGFEMGGRRGARSW